MRSLKILYVSVHEVLEYDDLRLLTARGHQVLSLGAYHAPGQAYSFRPPRPEFFSASLLASYHEHGGLSVSFINSFDVIFVNHDMHWIHERLNQIDNALIVYRTIGQSNSALEHHLSELDDRVKIVRYSNREAGLPGFAKTDAVIYFGKDLDLYSPWFGGKGAITFHNDYVARNEGSVPNVSQYEQICSETPVTLYGRGNNEISNWAGFVSFDEMNNLYRSCSCYLYTYTIAPSYTLSLMEAVLTGAPVVAPSFAFVAMQNDERRIGWNCKRYEVHNLLEDEEKTLLYDSIDEAKSFLVEANAGGVAIQKMSGRVRERARHIFDMDIIGSQWDDFFKEHLKS